MKPIDHNYVLVSVKEARQLNGGKLPESGYEALVMHNGQPHMLGQTLYQGTYQWAVVPTSWRMKDGRMVLDMEGIKAHDTYVRNLRRAA